MGLPCAVLGRCYGLLLLLSLAVPGAQQAVAGECSSLLSCLDGWEKDPSKDNDDCLYAYCSAGADTETCCKPAYVHTPNRICGASGSCTPDDEMLEIGGGSLGYDSVAYADEDSGVAGCKATCDASSDCDGFTYARDANKCLFRRSTSCTPMTIDSNHDCYKKGDTKTYYLQGAAGGNCIGAAGRTDPAAAQDGDALVFSAAASCLKFKLIATSDHHVPPASVASQGTYLLRDSVSGLWVGQEGSVSDVVLTSEANAVHFLK